jgi:hypothetical protein
MKCPCCKHESDEIVLAESWESQQEVKEEFLHCWIYFNVNSPSHCYACPKCGVVFVNRQKVPA